MTGQNYAESLSSDAYGHLVRATSDICTQRYHYYCGDEEAVLPHKLIVVANTRKVPIRGNEAVSLGSGDTGALEAKQVPRRGKGAYQFGLVPNAKIELQKWKNGVHSDFAEIERLVPEANYICMSEFGFPFGLRHREGIEIPPEADKEWRLLQSEQLSAQRFVCMGTSHRSFRRSQGSADFQYENVAVVFPSGRRPSLPPKTVFERKLEKLPAESKIEGVQLHQKIGGGITALFLPENVSASVRSDLSGSESKLIDQDRLRYAKNAFDYHDTIAKSTKPPVYLMKKSPARKLGEYLDASGEIKLDVFVTEIGVIAVLICYDAFDPSIFLSAVRMYYQSFERDGDFFHHGIDIFFIPAFNRSPKFVEMCQVLSRETNSLVVYVSGDERCETRSDVFVCGKPCAEWANTMTDGEPYGNFYHLDRIPGHEHIHVHTINKSVIDAAMRYMKIHASPSIRRSQILQATRLGPQVLD